MFPMQESEAHARKLLAAVRQHLQGHDDFYTRALNIEIDAALAGKKSPGVLDLLAKMDEIDGSIADLQVKIATLKDQDGELRELVDELMTSQNGGA